MFAANTPGLTVVTEAGKSFLPSPLGGTCAVRLIDRRTGATHRVNGNPLVIYTHNPDQAAADLLRGRDTAVWETRTDVIEASRSR